MVPNRAKARLQANKRFALFIRIQSAKKKKKKFSRRNDARLEILTAMKIQTVLFKVRKTFSDVVGYHRFGNLCCFHLHGEDRWCRNAEDHDLNLMKKIPFWSHEAKLWASKLGDKIVLVRRHHTLKVYR